MSSDFDLQIQPFKVWLRHRLLQAKRYAIDDLAKKLLEDTRIPARASLAIYRAQLRAKEYSADDIATFNQAW